MSQSLLRIQVVLGLVAFLGGCIGLPLPPRTIYTMIPKESLSFLEAGQTTKADVRKTLGEPWNTDETDSKWVYQLRAVVSGRWGYCGISPIPFDPDLICDVSERKYVFKLLEIDFNNSGVVTGWDEYESTDEKVKNLKVIVYGSLEKRDGLLYEPRSTSSFSGIHSWRHDNGQLAGQVSIRDGVEHGPYTTWYFDGLKNIERHYQGGKLNGYTIFWYTNGQKYTQDHFKDNRLHGLSTVWDPDGTVSYQQCFQNGEYTDLTPENCTP